MGDFATAGAYAAYVRKTHRFRRCIEAALCDTVDSGWTLDPIAGLAGRDLADLGLSPLPKADVPPWSPSPAARLGAAYVLEGSALGARLLLQRAQAIGLRQDFGARHLAHQSADPRRWRAFLTVLEALPDEMHQAAVAAAGDAFRLAFSIYSETADEFAPTDRSYQL
ncbi:hypothetical protein AWJ14_16600 [Hoeflea olei]|uniref:Heme oxygenase n=1 Tax=Hoeflea olei TaxID=1480615 RepID=A0A1C1YSU7_9HYPH|nr:hypothetical protein AWJ14_16600 [Hoeflea olei]